MRPKPMSDFVHNLEWNRHYDFNNNGNLAEIEKMARYDACYKAVYQNRDIDRTGEEYEQAVEFLAVCEKSALGGKNGYEIGVEVKSEWGLNAVIGAETENGEDKITKRITVFANNMLSLQSHNGRREEWEVQNGTLSLIMDGDLHDVSDEGVFKVTDGEKEKITDPNVAVKNGDHWTIILQPGSAHCMINRSNEDVTVVETQRGICREADNKRFADQQRAKDAPRATLPLTSEILFKSAQIYWAVERDIANKPELKAKGWKSSVSIGA